MNTEAAEQALRHRDYSDNLLVTAAAYLEASSAPGLPKRAREHLVAESSRLRGESRTVWSHASDTYRTATGENMPSPGERNSLLHWAERTVTSHLGY